MANLKVSNNVGIAKNFKTSGMIGDSQAVTLTATMPNGSTFVRVFANYALLEQWLATDTVASGITIERVV
jgi:hypothetical protein